MNRIVHLFLTRGICILVLLSIGLPLVSSVSFALEGKTEAEVWFSKGVVLFNLGRHEEAIECYDKTLNIDTQSIGAWLNKGSALLNLGRYEEAVESYDKALAIDPQFASAWHSKGGALRLLGRYEESLECCDKALAINPQFSYAWLGKGLVLHELGRREEAKQCFDKAVTLNPALKQEIPWTEIADSLVEEGNGLYSKGDYKMVLARYNEALQIYKESGDKNGEGIALVSIGIVYYSIGDYQKALEYYQQALKIARDIGNKGGEGNALDSIARTYVHLGQHEDALSYYEEALEICREIGDRENEGHILLGIGLAYNNLGKHEDALGYFKQALKIWRKIDHREGEGHSLFVIGLLMYGHLNRDEDAIGYFEKALEIFREIGDYKGVVETIEALGEMGAEQVVPKLIELLKDKNADVRKCVVSALGEIGTEQAVLALIDMLKDKDESVRSEALSILSEKCNEEAIPPLMELLKDEDIQAQKRAIDILGKIGNSRAVPPLMKLLRDENLYWEVAFALGEIGDPNAVPLLINMLKDDDVDARKGAALALARMADKQAVLPLLDALRDEDTGVRISAAIALGEIGDEQAVPPLIVALKDEDSSVRSSAARALGKIGDNRAVLPLIDVIKDALKKEEAFGIRLSKAIEALGKIGDNRAVSVLIDTLNDENEFVRWHAAKALGKIGDNRAVSALIDALNDEDRYVRTWAARALGKIGDNRAVLPLIDVLKDRDKDVRYSAAEALGEIGDRRAISPLVDVLETIEDEERWVRWSAAEALGKIGDGETVPLLIKALSHHNADVRSDAAFALGEIGDNRAVMPLIDALRDEDTGVREHAVEALGEIGDEQAVLPLIVALKDETPGVRWNAASVLGKIGDKRAFFPLIDALKDDIAGVRWNAARALSKMGDREAVPALIDTLNTWWSPYVIKDVVNSLKKLGDFSIVPLLLKESQKYRSVSRVEALLLAGWFCDESQNFTEELKISQRAYDEAVKIGNCPLEIKALWQMSEALLELGKPDGALRNLEKALELTGALVIEERKELDFPKAETFCMMGECYVALRKSREASDLFEDALRRIDRRLNLWGTLRRRLWWDKEKCERLKARILVGRGDALKEESKKSYDGGIKIYDVYKPQERREKERCERAYTGMISLLIAEGDYEEAQKYIEKALSKRMAELFDKTAPELSDPEAQKELEKGRNILKEIEEIKEKLQGLRKEKISAVRAKEQKEKAKELTLQQRQRQQEYKKFIYELKKTHPELASIMGSEPAELKDLQPNLSDNLAILQYLIGEDRLYIFVVTRNSLYAGTFDLRKQVLEEKVRNVLSLMSAKFIVRQAREMAEEEFSANFTKPLRKTLLDLYSYLIEPVEFELEGITRLGIIPNGILHYLPFSALMFKREDEKVGYLIEKYEVFYINSTTSLQYAMQKGRCKIGESKLIGFGNADGTLENAELEVRGLKQLFPLSEIYICKEATKERAKQPIEECSILHFATHGVLNSWDATKSFIVLAPKGEEGRLTVKEIWGLSLRNCQLVTLSACQTALGELIAGDEIVNLAGAFIFAGTPTVVATLWEVDDEMTTELMKEFYSQLKSGGMKTEAMQQAQFALLNGEKENFRHPFFWAPFILIGDYR